MNASCLHDSQHGIDPLGPPSLNSPDITLSSLTPQSDKPLTRNFRKPAILFRLFFVFLCFLVGSTFGWQHQTDSWQIWLGWGFTWVFFGLGLIAIEHILQRFPAPNIFQIGQSIAIGMVMTSIFSWLMTIIFPFSPFLVSSMSLASLLIFPYLTLTIRSRVSKVTQSHQPEANSFETEQSYKTSPKILDTSTIIDGRILALYETGFLEGPICIPRFVLRELHYIADSSQPWKRARGKRGLEVLSQLQALSGIDIQISEKDFPHIPEVDHKLIKLAQLMQGKIATNDWNLAKIASVEKVESLNVNRLFHQLKPPVLPGEVIRVLINKEGDLAGQGVAHLDDGTMIVVDKACDYVQETIDVVITKFMQTQSGRILFASRL